jgi:hypothetical protein
VFVLKSAPESQLIGTQQNMTAKLLTRNPTCYYIQNKALAFATTTLIDWELDPMLKTVKY